MTLPKHLTIKGEQSDVVFLDFSKASNRVSHHHLLHKLDQYGIHRDVLDWIKKLYLK